MTRRRKKGRRAKSGQWWRRYPRAVLWGSKVACTMTMLSKDGLPNHIFERTNA